jgi:hypothetical protein
MKVSRVLYLIILGISPCLLFGQLNSFYLDWSEPTPLADGPEEDLHPIALTDGEGGIWVVWMRSDTSSPMESILIASHYDGVDWSNEEVITPDSLAPVTVFEIDPPYGATLDSSGNLVVAWYNGPYLVAGQRETLWGIYMRTRTSMGWEEPEIVYDHTVITPVFSLDLTTAADGDLVLAFCAQEQDQQGLWVVESIYLTERSDTGWSFIYPIAEGYGNDSLLDVFNIPRIAPDDSGGVWLTYSEHYQEFSLTQERKVWVCYFKDGNPSAQQILSQNGTTDQDSDIVLNPIGEVLVCWTSEREGTRDLYHSIRSEGTWTPDWQLTPYGSAERYMPSVAKDKRTIFWIGYSRTLGPGDPDIWAFREEVGYGSKDTVTADPAIPQVESDILVTETDSIWVFWHQQDHDWDIYYSNTYLFCGDSNGDLIVTSSDGYVILNYLGSGPHPVSEWSSDTDGSGDIHPSDGYRILNYLGVGPVLECPYYE